MSLPIRPGPIAEVTAADEQREVDALRRALEARDDFLATAAHELRTPMGTLVLHVEGIAALARGTGDAQLAARIATLQAQMRHFARRATTLLDVSVLLAGKLQLRPEPVDVAEVVTEVTDLLRLEAERAGSAITLEAASPATGWFDRTRLEQVVMNLMSNAIKYGDGEPITVRLTDLDDRLVITVIDQGVGISDDDQKRIFGRFERVRSSSSVELPASGFGVGLWIVKEIVDAMGGTISVTSRSGEGSSFTVTLPLERHRNVQ